jgi:hypothetical protein
MKIYEQPPDIIQKFLAKHAFRLKTRDIEIAMEFADKKNFIQSLLKILGKYIDDKLAKDLEYVFPMWVEENVSS